MLHPSGSIPRRGSTCLEMRGDPLHGHGQPVGATHRSGRGMRSPVLHVSRGAQGTCSLSLVLAPIRVSAAAVALLYAPGKDGPKKT